MNDTNYIPGVCNINREEVAYRRKAAIFGLVLALFLFAVSLIFGLNVYLRSALIFVPLLIGVIGIYQVKNKFCVSYGASGQQNANDGGEAVAIADEEARAADKRKARSMNMQAFIISVAICVLLFFVPA